MSCRSASSTSAHSAPTGENAPSKPTLALLPLRQLQRLPTNPLIAQQVTHSREFNLSAKPTYGITKRKLTVDGDLTRAITFEQTAPPIAGLTATSCCGSSSLEPGIRCVWCPSSRLSLAPSDCPKTSEHRRSREVARPRGQGDPQLLSQSLLSDRHGKAGQLGIGPAVQSAPCRAASNTSSLRLS